MDNSAVMKQMLETAMKVRPESFANFDTTKNVQDQLQAMVGCNSPGTLIYNFYEWYHSHLGGHSTLSENETYYFLMSIEQLWLAYVMFEKWGKIWRDGEWVVAK